MTDTIINIIKAIFGVAKGLRKKKKRPSKSRQEREKWEG